MTSIVFIQKWLVGGGFETVLLEHRAGYLVLKIIGDTNIFDNEGGGHRWQRVPPTEKGSRVHTSTVTVAVLQEAREAGLVIPDNELNWKTTRGSGAGGQNRNKVESAVVLTHLPTGITVRSETERSQYQNKQYALDVLKRKLAALKKEQAMFQQNNIRKKQIGSGMRGDKIRTIRMQDNVVIDHQKGVKYPADKYLKGEIRF